MIYTNGARVTRGGMGTARGNPRGGYSYGDSGNEGDTKYPSESDVAQGGICSTSYCMGESPGCTRSRNLNPKRQLVLIG